MMHFKKTTHPVFKELTYLMPGQLALPLPIPPGLGLASPTTIYYLVFYIEGSKGFHPEDRKEILFTAKTLNPIVQWRTSVRTSLQYALLGKCMYMGCLSCKMLYHNNFASIETALWKLTSLADDSRLYHENFLCFLHLLLP